MSQASDGRPKIGVVQLQQAIDALATLGAAGARSPAEVDVLKKAFNDAARTLTTPPPSQGTEAGENSGASIGIDPDNGRILSIIFDRWPPAPKIKK